MIHIPKKWLKGSTPRRNLAQRILDIIWPNTRSRGGRKNKTQPRGGRKNH